MLIKYNYLLLCDDRDAYVIPNLSLAFTAEQNNIMEIEENSYCYICFSLDRKYKNEMICLDYYPNKNSNIEWGNYSLIVINDIGKKIEIELDLYKYKKFFLHIILKTMIFN